jgi:hypothetical protein
MGAGVEWTRRCCSRMSPGVPRMCQDRRTQTPSPGQTVLLIRLQDRTGSATRRSSARSIDPSAAIWYAALNMPAIWAARTASPDARPPPQGVPRPKTSTPAACQPTVPHCTHAVLRTPQPGTAASEMCTCESDLSHAPMYTSLRRCPANAAT